MFVYNTRKFNSSTLHSLLKHGKWSGYNTGTITIEEFLETHLTFTDRESYLSWVKSWKEQYKALTLKCRAKRKLPRWDSDNGVSYDKWKNTEPVGHRDDLYLQARFMLMVRSLGKVRSWEMKQKNMQ